MLKYKFLEVLMLGKVMIRDYVNIKKLRIVSFLWALGTNIALSLSLSLIILISNYS
jgi:hypothetical protein